MLDSPEINAFALPGGYVYVTRGIMAYLDSEAELAGVLGHEIGHVTARHGAQQATRQAGAGVGVGLVTLGGALLEMATGVPGIAQVAGGAAQAGAAGLIASYSRDQELQADQLGAEYLVRTHYDPAHMVEVIQVLKDQERYAADAAKAAGRAAPSAPGWLASHPSNDQRLQQIRGTAKRLVDGQPAGWADEGRERYLKAIDGLTFRRRPRAGRGAWAPVLPRAAGHRDDRAAGLSHRQRQRTAAADQRHARRRAADAAGAGGAGAQDRRRATRRSCARGWARPTAAPRR